jgi:hypothetical protein
MWLKIQILAFASIVASVISPLPTFAEEPPPGKPVAEDAPFLTTNRILQASLLRISRSALWRQAADAVRATGRRALVATPEDVVIFDSGGRGEVSEPLDPGVLAEAIPISGRDSQQISSVVILVNLRLFQELHHRRLSAPRDFEADLDRILVHEVYGHAVPYLLAGDWAGRCADPLPGEPAPEACSIQRENAVRAELGLGHRADYGLASLRLAMGTR